MKVLYKTEASATGGRTGSAKTADGAFAVTLTTPKELGGPGGEGNNPEQLFAAGYSACFLGAIKFAAGKQKVKVAEDSRVTAKVGIGPRDDGERSEEHTSELQSLMRISYAVFCLTNKKSLI